jgi:hypothetical protein
MGLGLSGGPLARPVAGLGPTGPGAGIGIMERDGLLDLETGESSIRPASKAIRAAFVAAFVAIRLGST